MEASPEDCFRDAKSYVTLLNCLVNRATTRRTADAWEDTAASAPREWELSGQQHTQMCLPNLPTAVTP
jgi:hypothetical protein